MKRSNPVILAIDDDPNDLMLLQSAFRTIGVKGVQTVGGGHEAIAYLEGKGKFSDRTAYPFPNIVISDLKMVEGDGFAVLEHFRRSAEWAVIPTVILSGSQDNDDIGRAYLLGASSYHVKPSLPFELRSLLKALYDYWILCEVPEADETGRHISTQSTHKLGERFG